VKILVIIPITGLKKADIEERMMFLRSIARPGTKVDYVQVKEGPPAVESLVDHTQASAEVLKYVKKAEGEGYDAIISWCGGDPGVEAARTLVDIPVVGPGESMRLLASVMGKKVIGVAPSLPVLETRRDLKKTTELLKEAIEKKVKEGYDSFYLSCLALTGLGRTLREETGLVVSMAQRLR